MGKTNQSQICVVLDLLTQRSESWAFFHSDASTPSVERHRMVPYTLNPGFVSQDTPAVRAARPQVTIQTTPSNVAMLAEVHKLQQELDEMRRSQY